MREKPILFNGDMVRAILAGHKTQTRRVVKPQPYIDGSGNFCWNGSNYGQDAAGVPLARTLASHIPSARTGRVLCPFGRPGDRLWVRETWAQPTSLDPGPTIYRADYPLCVPDGFENVPPAEDIRWRPSIHMPRWACRLILELTGVRVERLQEISEADAIAEGLSRTESGAWLPGLCDHPEWAFHQLWAQVYGEPEWDINPWVWVIEFKAITQPRAALATD